MHRFYIHAHFTPHNKQLSSLKVQFNKSMSESCDTDAFTAVLLVTGDTLFQMAEVHRQIQVQLEDVVRVITQLISLYLSIITL